MKWNSYLVITSCCAIVLSALGCSKEQSWTKWDERPLPKIYSGLDSGESVPYTSELAYVCHITHSIVTVIDIQTNKIVGTIPSGRGSVWFTFGASQKRAYIQYGGLQENLWVKVE